MSRRLLALACCGVVALGAAGVVGVAVAARSDGSPGPVPAIGAAAVDAAGDLLAQVDSAVRVREAPAPAAVGPVPPAVRREVPASPFGPRLEADWRDPVDDETTCSVSSLVRPGDSGAPVRCVESALASLGVVEATSVDGVYDEAVTEAVRAVQLVGGLTVDGAVGPATASALGIWGGAYADALADATACDAAGRSVVVDRDRQLGWFCEDGAVAHEFPITTAISQPDPGDYDVYAKDLHASSTFGDGPSTMTHFVAFTHGKFQGARIAFHSVPIGADGEFVQPLESVGDPDRHGESSGCIRVLPDDAVAIWDWLELGGRVRVVT